MKINNLSENGKEWMNEWMKKGMKVESSYTDIILTDLVH